MARKPGFKTVREKRAMSSKEKQKRAIKSALTRRAEKKHYGVRGESVSMDTVLTPINMSTVPNGDGDTTRDGDQLWLRDMEMRWAVWMPTTTRARIRVVLFRWYDDTAPTAADIFEDATAQRVLQSPFNVDKAPKYHIIEDKRYNSYYQNGAFPVLSKKYFGKTLGRKNIQFQAGTTTGVGHIYLWFANSEAVGANSALISYYSHIRFLDQ